MDAVAYAIGQPLGGRQRRSRFVFQGESESEIPRGRTDRPSRRATSRCSDSRSSVEVRSRRPRPRKRHARHRHRVPSSSAKRRPATSGRARRDRPDAARQAIEHTLRLSASRRMRRSRRSEQIDPYYVYVPGGGQRCWSRAEAISARRLRAFADRAGARSRARRCACFRSRRTSDGGGRVRRRRDPRCGTGRVGAGAGVGRHLWRRFVLGHEALSRDRNPHGLGARAHATCSA